MLFEIGHLDLKKQDWRNYLNGYEVIYYMQNQNYTLYYLSILYNSYVLHFLVYQDRPIFEMVYRF